MPEENQIQEVQSAPTLRDTRALPEGVVPKQAQGYVIAGLAVLILMAVMFSKNHAKPAAKPPEPTPLTTSSDLNQRKIQELEQDLSADQRQSQQQAIAQRQATTATNNVAVPNPSQPGVPGPAAQLPAAAAQPGLPGTFCTS